MESYAGRKHPRAQNVLATRGNLAPRWDEIHHHRAAPGDPGPSAPLPRHPRDDLEEIGTPSSSPRHSGSFAGNRTHGSRARPSPCPPPPRAPPPSRHLPLDVAGEATPLRRLSDLNRLTRSDSAQQHFKQLGRGPRRECGSADFLKIPLPIGLRSLAHMHLGGDLLVLACLWRRRCSTSASLPAQ